MARKKLSEFTAKTLLFKYLDIPYEGVPVILKPESVRGEQMIEGQLNALKHDNDTLYVVKVDEGVKGRMKKGLVKLKVKKDQINEAIVELAQKGYSQFLIEAFIPHESSEEKYFSIERTREGLAIYYSDKGGIDIEQNQDKVKKAVLPDSGLENQQSWQEILDVLQISPELFKKIFDFFNTQYISFLEVNPFLMHNSLFTILDLAVEVDSTAEFFVKNGWAGKDFIGEIAGTTPEEKAIIDLKAKSQAAFKFDLLNPDGSIWVLLSGGGASIVLADEVYNQGYGKELANYGEYSGNPNTEETYIYTKNVLRLLLKSKAKKKVLIIGGGVANFTDIKNTFTGVIAALDEVHSQLQQQGVKVFVRRGGPNQAIGLAKMKDFLEKNNLLGEVVGPEIMITDVVLDSLRYLKQ